VLSKISSSKSGGASGGGQGDSRIYTASMTMRDNCQAAIAQLQNFACRFVAQTVAKVHRVAEECFGKSGRILQK
jgi:hypothetical protein